MTDLNAPLGQTGRKPSGAKAPRSPRGTPRPAHGGARLAPVAALTAAIALNAYAFLDRDPLPRTAMISLVELEPAPADSQVTGSVASPVTAPESNSGVNVVYSESQDSAVQSAPLTDLPEGRISEGGPKVIVISDPAAASVGQPLQMAHLPDDDALEDSGWGELPVQTADGRRPMDIYARPWSEAGGKRIAVVIGGLGLSQTGTMHALEKLPPEITLAFAPQGNSLRRWMQRARKQGHELLIQVPMEPFGYPNTNPGPQTLTVAADTEDNLDNLRWTLGRITNYTGVVNYLGGRLATSEAAMTPVLREVGARGLLYFNDGTGGGEQLGTLARALDVPYVAGQVIVDATQDPTAIKSQLNELERLAEINGYAIGSGSALEVTVDAVASWANGAKKRGFEIVGISALAR